jgi:hypothetical protein
MSSVSNLAKRLFAAGSLMLLAACGSAGPTDPTADRSGYLTVSAAVSRPVLATPVAATPVAVPVAAPKPGNNPTVTSGYNVPAN